MARKPAVTPLTQDDYEKKCDSQVVTIYAGSGSCVTPFTLPKDLLCYYSSTFARYFNGTSSQALSGFLILPLVDPALFAVLFDYIKQGSAVFPYNFKQATGSDCAGAATPACRVITDCVRTLEAFLCVCTAYDVPEAGSAIYEPLAKCIALAQSYGIRSDKFLTDKFVTIVFDTLPELPGGNPVFSLLMQEQFTDTLIDCLMLIPREAKGKEVSVRDYDSEGDE